MTRRLPAAACAAGLVAAAAFITLRRNPDWHTADCGCMFSLGLRPRILACAGHVHAREYIAEQPDQGAAVNRTTPIKPVSEKRRAAAERAGSTFTKPSAGLQRRTRLEAVSSKRTKGSGHHEAEFSPAVRLMIRIRAGHGQIENACCEACLTWLGEHGGQIQHIKARGMGGSRDPRLGSPVGGALLCGTPASGCHGLCEAWDPGMYEAGFWIKFAERLGAKPIRVGVRTGTWTERWLLADGTYGDEPAERADGELASKKFEGGVAA